jgi:hypothetical protein
MDADFVFFLVQLIEECLEKIKDEEIDVCHKIEEEQIVFNIRKVP